MRQPRSHGIQIAVCAAIGVDTSTLVRQYCHDRYDSVYEPTSMLDKHQITISDRNYTVTPYFASADGAAIVPPLEEASPKFQAVLLVYNVDNAASFAAVPKMYEKVLNVVNAPHQPRRNGRFPIALAAANAHVPKSARGVTVEQGKALATIMGCEYAECSTKENFGVDPIFNSLVSAVMAELKPLPLPPTLNTANAPTPMGVKKSSRKQRHRNSSLMWKGRVYKNRAAYLLARLFEGAVEKNLSGNSFRVINIREDSQSALLHSIPGLRPVTPDPRLRLHLDLPGPTISTPWSEHSGFRQRLSALNPFAF